MESLKRHFTQMTKNTDGGKKAQSLKPTGPCFLVESYYIRYNPGTIFSVEMKNPNY